MPDTNKLTPARLYEYFIIALTGKDSDFTTGSIRKAIFMLSIPMVLEMLMESIFALVDIAFVSRVSVNAVATIGLTESVITLIYAIAIGLSMAATAVVARRVGEKNLEGIGSTGNPFGDNCGHYHWNNWGYILQGNPWFNGWKY